MATSSSILAWRVPWTEEPGGLQSMGSQRELDTTEHKQADYRYIRPHFSVLSNIFNKN